MKNNDIPTEPINSSISITGRRPSLKINAMSNWASLGVNILIGFFLTPFIIHNLGKTGYGIWTLVGSFVGYYGLLNLGVGSAITRYIARYTGQGEQQKLNETFNTALVMFCVTGLVAVGLSFAIAGPLATFFKVEDADVVNFKRLIWIIGITTGISFPAGVLGATVTAREHFIAVNVVTIIRGLLRAGLVVVFINLGWGVLGVGLAPLFATLFAMISNMLLFKQYGSDVAVSFKFVNRKTLKMLLLYGGVTTVIAIADILRFNLDSTVIAKFIDVQSVGIYGVAAIIIRYITRALSSAMGVLSPRFSILDGAGKSEEIRELFLKTIKISAFMGFGFCMFAIMFGPRFIVFWAGIEYLEAGTVLVVLSIGYAFGCSQVPVIPLLYALNKHYIFAMLVIVEGVFNLILSLFLVSRYGIIGVAIGTSIPLIVIQFIVKPIILCQVVKINIWDYAKSLLVPAVFCSLISVMFFCANLASMINRLSLSVYSVVILSSFLIYFVCGLFYLSKAMTFSPKTNPFKIEL